MTHTSRRILWVLTAATLLAAILRLLHLHSLPPAAWFDEIFFALRAREIASGGPLPIFFETSFGGANAGPAYTTALWRILGFTSITAGRLTPALTGLLSIPLAYACFHQLLAIDRRIELPANLTAALAAIVLSYTLVYTTIARVNMEIGVAPPVALFVVWQMLLGYRRRHRPRAAIHFLIAGLTIGIAQYNGLHARFILPLLAYLGLELFILSDREQHFNPRITPITRMKDEELAKSAQFADRILSSRRLILWYGMLMLIAAIIAALPLILWFAAHPDWFTGRASIVTEVGPGLRFKTYSDMLGYNTRMIARVFFVEGSYDPKNGIPGLPLLDFVQAIGFVSGLIWALARLPRSITARAALVWLVIMTLPSLLTEGAPNLGRMIGIVPPMALLVALGWAVIYGWLTRRLPHRAPALSMLAAIVIALSAGYHTYLLFVRWPEVPNLREQFTAAPVDLANEAIARAEAGEPTFVGLIPEADMDIAAFEYLMPGTPVQRFDLRKCLPRPHNNDTRVNYIIITGRDDQTLDMLRSNYDLEVEIQDADLFQTIGSLTSVQPGAVFPPYAERVRADFEGGIELLGFHQFPNSVKPGEQVLITTYWHMTGDIDEDLTAFAHIGTGIEGQSPLIAQRDGQPCLGFYPTSQWQPGLVIEDGFTIHIPPDAPPGQYPIAVGWYSFPALTRLPLLDAEHPLPDDRAIIGSITLRE